MFTKAVDIILPSQVKKFKMIEPWTNTVSSLGLVLSCHSLYSIAIVATPTEPSSLQQGGYTTAKVSGEEAYELRRGYLGDDDNYTMGSLSLLATVLKAQDKFEEAEATHR
jgi:hypothetical protein